MKRSGHAIAPAIAVLCAAIAGEVRAESNETLSAIPVEEAPVTLTVAEILDKMVERYNSLEHLTLDVRFVAAKTRYDVDPPESETDEMLFRIEQDRKRYRCSMVDEKGVEQWGLIGVRTGSKPEREMIEWNPDGREKRYTGYDVNRYDPRGKLMPRVCHEYGCQTANVHYGWLAPDDEMTLLEYVAEIWPKVAILEGAERIHGRWCHVLTVKSDRDVRTRYIDAKTFDLVAETLSTPVYLPPARDGVGIKSKVGPRIGDGTLTWYYDIVSTDPVPDERFTHKSKPQMAKDGKFAVDPPAANSE